MSTLFQAPPVQSNSLGFPPKTPVAEMTAEEQAAYWRHETKKQQRLLRLALRQNR
jgi:hypothetical protein